ncbi:LysE family translocator [Flavobacterium sp.]|jgi:threonine/homoserine/homoserine lactone efflux protein|uniref:LysE family translocator n=1 Tax=Flavobacterium sp. TaxID=239 RepID=UPI0037C01F04
MIDDILAAVPLGFFLSFMIGPVFFVLLETSITKGFRAAVTFDLGVLLGDVVFITIAYFSSYRLITSIKDQPALFVFGGILMLTYGVISFFKLRKTSKLPVDEVAVEIIRKDYFGLFAKGFLLNFINIGVLAFWLAIIITIGPKLDMEQNRMIVFFASVLLSYFVTDLFKIVLAKKLRAYLNPHNIIKIKKLISIVLMVSGLLLMIQGWLPKNKELINTLDGIEKQEYK